MSVFEICPPKPWQTIWFKRLSSDSGCGVFWNPGHWGFGLEFWPRSTVSLLFGPVTLTYACIRSTADQ